MSTTELARDDLAADPGTRPASTSSTSSSTVTSTVTAAVNAGSLAGYRYRWVVLFLVLAAEVMDLVDATIVNIAAPSIRTELGGSARRACSGSSPPTRWPSPSPSITLRSTRRHGTAASGCS